VLKKLLDLLVPSRCAACGACGEPCCARCEGVWGSAAEVVRTPTAGLVRVFALARYRGVARRLLIAYKERGRRDLAPSLGRALADALAVLPLPGAAVTVPSRAASALSAEKGTGSAGGPVRAICLVPAPSRRSAARVRGGPHVERLANAAASVLAARGIEVAVAPALELAGGVRDAVGLDRAERMANLAGRLRFRQAGRPPPGYALVVLDDVVTTGATAAACVRALASEGFTVSAVLTLLATG
jgi:predicted amidophosphoribosyltransferase